jgi:hypothetical protein
MPWVEFETTIPPFEGAKKVRALYRAATVKDEFDIVAYLRQPRTA